MCRLYLLQFESNQTAKQYYEIFRDTEISHLLNNETNYLFQLFQPEIEKNQQQTIQNIKLTNMSSFEQKTTSQNQTINSDFNNFKSISQSLANLHGVFNTQILENNGNISQTLIEKGFNQYQAFANTQEIIVPKIDILLIQLKDMGLILLKNMQNDKDEDVQFQRKLQFLVNSNANIDKYNINQFCEIFEICINILKNKINIPKNYSIDNLIGRNQKQRTFNLGLQEKIEILLILILNIHGEQLNKKMISVYGEINFQLFQQQNYCLKAYVQNFEIDLFSITKQLYKVTETVKKKVSISQIICILEKSRIKQDSIFDISKQQQPLFCPYEKLSELLKSCQIDESVIVTELPETIKNLNSPQKMDIWSSYICIQILNSSFIFLDLLMNEVNYNLELKGIFFIDAISQYEDFFQNILQKFNQ
ncbi:hypothetical protein ABPG74_007747 [Tetrahymena malaccensis]